MLDAEGAAPALAPLGATGRASGRPDLTVGPDGDLRPHTEGGEGDDGEDAVALRVHEGLDAKVSALGALRGALLTPEEGREVIAEAMALGAGTGAEGFVPRDEGARARLAALLQDRGGRTA